MKVLSTKGLSLSQKELLLNAGLSFVEYDCLKINFLPLGEINLNDDIIITSKNAFRSIKDSQYWKVLQDKNWWVIGERTTAELQKHNLNIKAVGKNSADLAQKIIQQNPEGRFTYFTGNMRREELPSMLREHRVFFAEEIVYNTVLTPKKIEADFNGILFFSPSGVESYTLKNNIRDEFCFCIGNTTADEVRKFTDKIVIANKASVENVIVQAVKCLKKEN